MLYGFHSRNIRKLYEADKGDNASGGTAGDTQSGNSAEKENAGTEKLFTQADLDTHIDNRLKREREKSQREKEAAEKAATEKALAEQGEFKTLAEQRAAELAESKASADKLVESEKSLKETMKRFEAAIKAHLESLRKDVPKHIIALLDKLDPVDQLDYIASNRDELVKQTTNTNGTPRRDQVKKPDVKEAQPRQRFTL